METYEVVKVWVVTDRAVNSIPCSEICTAEELCIALCKKHKIPPLTRTLFSLRVKGTDYFLKDNFVVISGTREYELRIRYKVPVLGHLITLDEVTYDYYFQQARNDVNDNRVPEIKYPEHKKELLGLGITDMCRCRVEEQVSLKDVVRNYKKYIPKVISKRHGPFPKKYAHEVLPKIPPHDVNYIKSQYLQQMYMLAPNYLAEEYRDVVWKKGNSDVPVHLHVAPFYTDAPGLRLYETVDRKWTHICTIEEIIYLTRNGNNCLEVSRRGTPLFFTFQSEQQLSSFISVCDGYYRLMVKWTFNLSKDDESPSLRELHRIKCHGPVGGAFSYRKLEEKRGKKHGCYILRQCQDDYNVYYLDVCTKHSTTETYRLEFRGDCYMFNNEQYFSIDRLVSCHQNPEGRIYLKECIPPSEYDKSQLLLCGEVQRRGVRIDQAKLQDILKDNKSPRCLSAKDILLYTGPWCYTDDKDDSNLYAKQYCDVPFCDDRDCELFARQKDFYSHFISFNQTDITFSVRLWNPDTEVDGLVKILLSVLSVPASTSDIDGWGSGIELTISNNETFLSLGNKELFKESTPGILKATAYTEFRLSWSNDMLILGKIGVIKPLYMNEIDKIGHLLTFTNLTFSQYSVAGSDAMWEFPFCDDEFVCEVHTTFKPEPLLLWPLRRTHMNYELELFVRSFRLAIVHLFTEPYHGFPRISVHIGFPKNITRVVYHASAHSKAVVLSEIAYSDLIYYWEWTELHFTMFAQEMLILRNIEGHLETVMRIRHDVMNALRWFSLASDYSLSHWSVYCEPADLPAAYPPDCALTVTEFGYSGDQWVTGTGLPCIPWIDEKNINAIMRDDKLFVNGTVANVNYCRNVKQKETGPWCYALSAKGIHEEVCQVRRCSALDCKVAGTANDYAGQIAVTRSGRICVKWSETLDKTSNLFNDSFFPESDIHKADNFCRNPTRTLAGAWCYTNDIKLEKDLCEVDDCTKEETNIVLTKHGGDLRYIYTLPEWKHSGHGGGLHFSLKEWNPDYLDGILFKVFSSDRQRSLTLYIGAANNEKVILRFQDLKTDSDTLLVERALPHLIPAGKWANFWLQMLKGELRLGYQKRENAIFEWKTDNSIETFESSYMTYQSLEGNVIGVYFPEKQCHTENTTTLLHTRIFPIGMWRVWEVKDYSNLTIYLRGTGIALIPLLTFPGSEKVGSDGITTTHKALWKLDETRKLEVAFKTLQRDKANDYLKDFMDLASQWACVQSSAIVRFYGITLSSPSAMVLEYLPYGPFSDYLRDNEAKVNPLHLKKVSANFARALWDLSEAGIVHGYIRCSRLLLAARDDERMVVKLSGPSLHVYTEQDIHWIPVEFFSDMSLVKRSAAGDTWAFATTLWEIFSYGQSPTETNPVLMSESYEMGHRLLRPSRCPSEVWSLIRQCWQADPHSRVRPQEIMRDLNHMLHIEYVPRNEYEEPTFSLDHVHNGETDSSGRFISSETSDASSNRSLISTISSAASMNGTLSSDQYDNQLSDKTANILDRLHTMDISAACGSGAVAGQAGSSRPDSPDEFGRPSAPRLMESIVSQGNAYVVTLGKKIGTGNYGDVYKGWMERDNEESQGKVIAAKRLSRKTNAAIYEDFKNEMEIMKSLQHDNVVEILGYAWEHGSDVLIVMEYLEQGSLFYYLKYQEDKLTISNLIQYALDIAAGMDYVSAKNIVHRDLAARNILVVNKRHVKISDFGLARIIPKEESTYRIKTERLLPINWYAPESAVKPWHFSTKSDVWSYGVTAWEIFTLARQEVPKFDVKRPRERASCFPIPESCPSEIFRHLMKDCWEVEPSRRPKFIDLVHLCKRFNAEYK